jgi:hypothetical protein
MWNQLKDWIRAGTEKGSNRRRFAQSHFRGQFEQLEARTVLSASIGVAPVDLDVAVVSPWNGAYAQTGLQQRYASEAAEPWENSYPAATGKVQNDFQQLGRLDPIVVRVVSGTLPPQRLVYVVYIDYQTPPAGPPTKPVQLQSSSPEQELSSIPKPIAATSQEPASQPNHNPVAANSPYGGPQDNHSPAQTLQARSPVERVGSLLNLLSPSSASTDSVITSTSTVLGVRDTAFQSFSSESLLLATSVDEWQDADTDLLGDGLLATSDKLPEDLSENNALSLDDGVDASFDTLHSELNAIDAVLTELHTIDRHTEKRAGDVASDSQQQQNAATPFDDANALRTANSQDVLPSTNDTAKGGMVLLEPSGDANLCAYDLTAVFAGNIQESVELPLGMEVSVGIYQALDIGGNELHPTADSAGSVAPAAAAARPSISAEKAPTEGSERTS